MPFIFAARRFRHSLITPAACFIFRCFLRFLRDDLRLHEIRCSRHAVTPSHDASRHDACKSSPRRDDVLFAIQAMPPARATMRR